MTRLVLNTISRIFYRPLLSLFLQILLLALDLTQSVHANIYIGMHRGGQIGNFQNTFEWPVYLRSGQSNWTKIGPLGQLIFSGHLGQQLSFLPCHSISTDNRLIMKFPDKTLKFNFNHSPKAINSLITQAACVYLDLLPHVKRILTEIYAGNQYFIIQ